MSGKQKQLFKTKIVPGTAQAGGELLTFDLPAPSEARQAGDPETRLPAIDRLEGFHPGGSSMYRRVMVVAQVETAIMPVWLYSMKYRSNWKRVANGLWEPL